MKQSYISLVIVAILILFIWIYISIADFTPQSKDDILIKKITELELKIDSLNSKKDSIRSVVDSTHVKIITNEKHYQERINTIMLQSSSADSSFLSDYIRQYRSKNDSINIQ